MHHQDAMFRKLYFGSYRVLKTIGPDCEELRYRGKENLLQDCYDILHPGTMRPFILYTSIISKEPELPNIAVGQTRPTNLRPAGVRFLVLGTFSGLTQLEIEKTVEQLGSIMLTKVKTQVLINNCSVRSHCYLLIEVDSVLRAATEILKKSINWTNCASEIAA